MVHSNPILDTWTYEVKFPDGQVAEYLANIITENMYPQCDTKGNQYILLKEIVDWQKDDTAVHPKAEAFISHGAN